MLRDTIWPGVQEPYGKVSRSRKAARTRGIRSGGDARRCDSSYFVAGRGSSVGGAARAVRVAGAVPAVAGAPVVAADQAGVAAREVGAAEAVAAGP
jgi:hypothetical protein